MTYDLVDPAKVTRQQLADYKAVITPSLRYMSDATLSALDTYPRGGSLWLNIGDSGRFDDAGHLRPIPTPGGRVVRFGDLNDLLAYPRFAPYLLNENQADSLKETQAVLDAALTGEHPMRIQQPKQDLLALLQQQTSHKLSVLAGLGLEGLRCNLWRKHGTSVDTLTAHFVNYYCLIPTDVKMGKGKVDVGVPPDKLAPKRLEGVRVELELDPGRVKSIRAYDPDLSGSGGAAVQMHGVRD